MPEIIIEDNEADFYHQRYKYVDSLGKGCWFRVVDAYDKVTGQRVAVKILDPNEIAKKQMLERRISAKEAVLKAGKFGQLKPCSNLSPTFIEVHGQKLIVIEPLYKRFLSEYLNEKAPHKKRKYLGNGLEKKELVEIASGIANGLCELLKYYNLSHCDLKPDNIAYDDKPVITDFGAATIISHYRQEAPRDNMGCVYTREPQRFIKRVVPTKKSDIYAFGALLHLMIKGKYPFEDELNKLLASNEPQKKLVQWAESMLVMPERYEPPRAEVWMKLDPDDIGPDDISEYSTLNIFEFVLACLEKEKFYPDFNDKFKESVHEKIQGMPFYNTLEGCLLGMIESAEELKQVLKQDS